jgi:hypothetical protein
MTQYMSSINDSPTKLREAIEKYNGHPYATVAALELLKDGVPIEALPQDPTGENILGEQWRRVCSKGPDSIHLFESYACLPIPLPDRIVERIAGLTRQTRLTLLGDRFLSSLIREEDVGRRIYHSALAEYIGRQCDGKDKAGHLDTAVAIGLSDTEIGFYDRVRLVDLWQDQGSYTDEAIDAFLQLYGKNDGIRRHFAKNVRDGQLVRRLYERGFFESMAEPLDTGSGIQYAPWLEGAALLAVADQVPDVVATVVQTAKTTNYLAYDVLAEAIAKVPYGTAKGLWPAVVGWLKSCEWHYLPHVYVWLARRLIENSDLDEALAFLKVVLSPFPPRNDAVQNVYLRQNEATGRFDYHELSEYVGPLVEAMESQKPFICVPLLEEVLWITLALESDSSQSDFCKIGHWRAAIEDHERNIAATHHKDLILVLLRDVLERHVEARPTDAKRIVTLYLNHQWELYKRLGLHLVRRAGAASVDLAVEELTRTGVLDNSLLHHEVLLLLRDVFPKMRNADQKRVVAAIEAGPDEAKVTQMAESAKQRWPDQVNIDRYCREYKARWIRTRLQMVSGSLTDTDATYYDDLVTRYGLNAHPDFLSPPAVGGVVDHVAPISASEWSRMSARECVDFMITWKPEPEDQDFLKRVCPTGLARLFKDSLLSRWTEFVPELGRLIENAGYPTYTSKVLEYLSSRLKSEAERVERAPCILDVHSCLEVVHLARTAIRRWASVRLEGDTFEVGYPLSVCRDVLNMFESLSIRIDGAKPRKTGELIRVFEAVRDLAIDLCGHADPTQEEDDPADERHVAFNDPLTTSINHVRPMALRELLRYAVARANVLGLRGKRWEPEVERRVTVMLTEDRAYSIRSVFGECWGWLYHLDEEWARSHHAVVFPAGAPTDRSFIAAWDSYVTLVRFTNDPGYDLMRPLYIIAIDNATTGRTTNTNRASPDQLAWRLAGFYWHEVEPFPSDDRGNPLVHLYRLEASRLHSHLAWTLWKMCKNTDDTNICGALWKKARVLWQYRLEHVGESNWNAHYAEELSWFVHFLTIEALSIKPYEVRELMSQSIRPLGMCDREHGLRELVKYLAGISDAHVSDSVRLLRQVLETHGAHWYFKQATVERILSAAEAADATIKAEACRIVHILGEHGHDWARPYLDRLRR